MARIVIDIPWNLFEESVGEAVSRTVRIAAAEVIAEASENIRNVAPHERDGEIVTDLIDTGAMLNSGYIVTSDQNGRSQAISSATSRQPGVAIGLPDPEPLDEFEAQANYAAGYAPYVEARYPFLEPAAETVRQKVDDILVRELKKEGL